MRLSSHDMGFTCANMCYLPNKIYLHRVVQENSIEMLQVLEVQERVCSYCIISL